MKQFQIDLLERAYQQNANWGNQEFDELAERLNISRSKVYKWNWDRKKKDLAVLGPNKNGSDLASVTAPEAVLKKASNLDEKAK